nr:hypothetical protein OH820_31950 [Streptomyces sp. NBC_00857]
MRSLSPTAGQALFSARSDGIRATAGHGTDGTALGARTGRVGA